MSTPAPTAIVYCRTSTTGQKESETIKAQIERCKRLVERHGVHVLKYGPRRDGWLVDDGVTGSLLQGREFGKLVDDLEAGRTKPVYLIVFSLSRISRLDKSSRDMKRLIQSHTDNARIKGVLLGSQVKVIDEEGLNDPTTVMYDLKTTLSVEEYRLIRSRTMSGKSQRLSEGKFAKGGKPPYGYVQVPINGVDRKQGWTLAPHPEDAKRLKIILGWFVEGGVTHAARLATKAGIPTPMAGTTNRKGKAKDWSPTRWSPVSVQHIARNAKVYLGEQTLTFDNVPHTLKYPALIDSRTFSAIAGRMKTKTLKRRATMLSTGLVDCTCGAHIHERNSHGKHYTQCADKCGSIYETTFSAALWSMVVCRLVQIRKHERSVSGGKDPYGPGLKTAKGKLTLAQEQMSKLLDLYMEGSLDKTLWKAKNEPLADARAQAQADVERIEAERAAHEQKRASQQSVEARVQAVLRELGRERDVPLDRQRRILSDVLGTERVIVSWAKRKKGEMTPYVSITLPAFGQLPPVTVRTDRDVTVQMHGVTKDALETIYDADDQAAE